MLSSHYSGFGRWILSCIAGVALHAQAAPQYTATLLTPPEGSYTTYVYAISNAGVVGYVEPFSSIGSQPAYWSLQGEGRVLPTLAPSAVGRSIHYAYNINNAGQIVGRSSTVLGDVHGYLLTPGGQIQDLGALPMTRGGTHSPGSNAQDVNGVGSVVGESYTDDGLRAFLWTSNGGMRNLGVLEGGSFSTALAINDAGSVVGVSEVAGGRRAFLWTEAGGMQDLGDLAGGANSSTAKAINGTGQVIGTSQTAEGSRAFLWTQAEGMVDLGLLSGHVESFATGLNESGATVGYSRTANWYTSPFLWTREEGMIDLNSLLLTADPLVSAGLTLTYASGINDAGQILVSGQLNGRSVTAVLTPVPEPSTWVLSLLGGGLLLMAVRRVRRGETH
ncbi:DUF3466 family protein [Aquabacterium soli]|uniref:DUF3466 family protein n=1 Tax=Aquabacterium soli TaxID=2493092 RepID=A0A426VA61_9BURK|nr:HAF repeat-containing PEP-CTERM protein [Aquabacterium soli]RRS03773.1 DUF3466 family protein [Aquabacterium soli]